MANPQPRDYALVVGIDDYPRYGSQGRNLKGAVRDAGRFYDWLTDSRTGGGLDPDNCRLLTSAGNPLGLTQASVDVALDDLWTRARASDDGGRRFYFFFSGHGQLVAGADAVTYAQSLCLPHWSRTMPHAAINADSYADVVKTCMPFEEVAMFVDCCRVPSVKVRAFDSSVGCSQPLDGFDLVNRMAFFAAEPMRRAFEGDFAAEDDDAEPEVHGFFTTALLEGLEAGSDRPGGGIGAEALWKHLDYRLPMLADARGRRQVPRRAPLLFSDDVVFGAAKVAAPEAPDAPNFEIRFTGDRVGPVRLLDADATPVREGMPGSGPWTVRLVPNRTYMLVDDGDGTMRSFVFLPAMEGRHDNF